MKRSLWVDVICYLFVFLFVYAASSKLVAVSDFRILISKSPLLSPIAGFVAWFIPLFELVIAGLLVAGRYRWLGLLGSFGLMLAFTIYIYSILQFSEDVPCSCGGVLQQLGWEEHLVFNIFFTSLALIGLVLEAKQKVPSNSLNQSGTS